MSRYTTNKHGLTIGYGNIFFHQRPDQNGIEEYGAIVWTQGYDLSDQDSSTYFIQTPLQQLLYCQETFHWPTTGKHEQFAFDTRYVLKPSFHRWLEDKGIAYGTRPQTPRDTDIFQMLFFKRVRDARAFRAMTEEKLKGFPKI